MDLGPTAIRDLLTTLLDQAATALTNATEADPVPEHVYVRHGTYTAEGCDQLNTGLVRVVPRLDPDPRSQSCAVIHRATLAVVLYRCIPSIDEDGGPGPAEQDAAFQQLAVDGWVIWKGLTAACAAGEWPEDVSCKQVAWGQLEPIAPLGGVAGWRIEVTVTML